jgi:hypothetical protein
MKVTYAVTLENGEQLTRKSEKEYTHAVVCDAGYWAWTTRYDLAQKYYLQAKKAQPQENWQIKKVEIKKGGRSK